MCLLVPETKSWSSEQQLFSEAAKSRRPDEVLWFLRQHFAPASPPLRSLLSSSLLFFPPSSLATHSATCALTDSCLAEAWHSVYTVPSPPTQALSIKWHWRETLRCVWTRGGGFQPCRLLFTVPQGGRVSGLFSPALWLRRMASGWSLRPLVHWCCLVPCECGSGLIALWQR